DDAIPVWSSDAKHLESLRAEGLKLYLNSVEPDMWQGYSLQPPLMHFGDKSILAAISTESDLPNYSFQLPDKPFVDEDDFHTQHLAVSVRPPLFRPKKLGTTFFAPFLPELNDFYRRNATFPGTGVRVEVRGLGIVTEADVSTLTVTGFRTQELISRVFSVFGFKAEISHAGRFATRLIEQMGGIQGCRVFKIRGVRRLIEQYSPLKSFTKSAAIQLIRDINPVTKVSNFGKYESLFIKYRETPKLTPELVFNYLAEKDVFRVGLALKCPSCELDFWVPLDDAKTEIQCEYCGNRFNIMPYLHDRDWAYRRSGLFGRDDHQQGSIPVALTIQQLETILHGSLRSTIFVGGQQIKMMGPPSKECEVDFVALVQDVHGRIQIAFGECKTGHYGITAQDVGNLSVLADAFPRERVQPFIVFSKTSPFTEAEIELCRKAQGKAWEQRVILLSDRELEPYYAYEDAANEFEVKPSASSLDMMAMATQTIYFHPKRRS
ncbi:MAG TPA: hypothetical protein VFP71_15380, partial [Candidatus Angelobacter sp.]|nr:hypothetical protein [Candidatus Angelobacter sp.]